MLRQQFIQSPLEPNRNTNPPSAQKSIPPTHRKQQRVVFSPSIRLNLIPLQQSPVGPNSTLSNQKMPRSHYKTVQKEGTKEGQFLQGGKSKEAVRCQNSYASLEKQQKGRDNKNPTL